MCGVLGIASTNNLVDEFSSLFSYSFLLVRYVSAEEIRRLFTVAIIIMNPRHQCTEAMGSVDHEIIMARLPENYRWDEIEI
jgi:hypothetical protein